jgi:nicotinamide mononucleotide (NMN) deamidase PncC
MSTAFPPPALKEVAHEVASLLKERKETISVAETAAGGLISAAILATPGASQIYRGGLTVSTTRLPLTNALLVPLAKPPAKDAAKGELS